MIAIRIALDVDDPSDWDTLVPIEVCDDAMRPIGTPRLVNLARRATIEVEHAGRYYVIATLPTGESVSASVEASDDGSAASAVLVPAAVSSPRASQAWALTRHHTQDERRVPEERPAPGGLEYYEVLVEAGYKFGVPRARFLEPDKELSSLDVDVLMKEAWWLDSDYPYHLRRRSLWELDSPRIAASWTSDLRSWKLQSARQETSWELYRPRGRDPSLLGRLQLERSAGPWCPAFVRYSADSMRGRPTVTLVAVPAGGGGWRYSDVLFARAGAVSADEPRVRALVRGARTEAEALLSYLDNGVFTAVHQLRSEIVERAAMLLCEKRDDPFAASIAGYVLLRTQVSLQKPSNEYTDWMQNLVTWFPNIPDGAVILAASLLGRPRWLGEVRFLLLEAVSRGIPTYTIGLRLLLDMLRSLVRKPGRDATLDNALARVRAVAAYADWTAQTTTLTLPVPTPQAFPLDFEVPD